MDDGLPSKTVFSCYMILQDFLCITVMIRTGSRGTCRIENWTSPQGRGEIEEFSYVGSDGR